jgi:alkylation response protein AidB-like acyl-CoA dehydrogenase
MVFQEEYERAGAPARINAQGLMLAGPVVMRFGTPDQKERWLEPMLKADHIWCQGFSEPDSGSDLASLRTKGRVKGDHIVVSGQKIWTSVAPFADWIFALVRTDPNSSRNAGISWLMIDMQSPGLEVRPIHQIDGRTDFAEVFFNDVTVPRANVIGELGQGWQIAMAALGLERGVGRRSYVQYLGQLATVKQFATKAGLANDPATQESLGALLGGAMVYRHFVNRVATEGRNGGPAPVAVFNKLYWSEYQTRLFETGMGLLGASLEQPMDGIDPAVTAWEREYWYSRAARIFAGSNEIQRNIIAERVLGLPK